MRVAIAGAGTAGGYLYALLTQQGFGVDLFDVGPTANPCGITSCAWGTSKGFSELVRGAGLNPSDYILTHFDHVSMDGVRLGGNLMTFDKPALTWDLLNGAKIHRSKLPVSAYDRVIDATGAARALLPPIAEDLILQCVQFRVRSPEPLETRIQLGSIGYAWCFPLSEDRYHIGCGNLRRDPREVMAGLDWLPAASGSRIICQCAGRVRASAPYFSLPFVVRPAGTEIWGVGESIGCVGPLVGDGVVPGMKSVHILLDNWEDPRAYTRAILREFTWMKKERRTLDKLRKAKSPGITDAWMVRQNAKRMGMAVSLRSAAKLMRHMAP